MASTGDNYSSTLFTYGAELQGRGEPTEKDVYVGTLMLLLAALAVSFGILSLYFVWKMDIFHNAFGWFWATLLTSEVISDLIHVAYSAPVTIMQPRKIPPFLGISVFLMGYFFAVGGCVTHQVVSLNRCIAVYFPIKYKIIFTKRNCMKIMAACWLPIPLVMACFLVFPCNAIGYSPQLYQYAFIKCSADVERNFSIVGTILNHTCLFLSCGSCIVTDILTLGRIVYIRKFLRLDPRHARISNRDIRFFVQTAVQNVIMVAAAVAIVVANNEHHLEGDIIHIFGFNTLLFKHVNNGLALLIFNPEVRKKLRVSSADYHKINRSLNTLILVYLFGWFLTMFGVAVVSLISPHPRFNVAAECALGTLANLNLAAPFFIYYFRSTLYRNEFRRLFGFDRLDRRNAVAALGTTVTTSYLGAPSLVRHSISIV